MNKNNTSHQNSHAPHDLFFKDIFSQKPFAIELLKLILSAEEQKLFHLHTLKNEKTSFKSHRADLIFSLKLKSPTPYHTVPPHFPPPVFPCEKTISCKTPPKTSLPSKQIKTHSREDTKKALIFFILEHKSHKDKTCLFQILKYQTLLYSQLLKQKNPLVPLIPIIFYHGKEPWQIGSFQDLFPKNVFSPSFESFFGNNVLNFYPRILNLNTFGEKKMERLKTLKSGMALYLLKKIWYFKWPEDGKRMLEWVQGLSNEEQHDLLLFGSEYIKDVCRVSQGELEKLELEALKTGILRKGGSMGLLEYVRQKKVREITQTATREGLQKGLQQGLEKGLQKGRQEAQQELILNMLKAKADLSFISQVTGLSEQELKNLKNGSQIREGL